MMAQSMQRNMQLGFQRYTTLANQTLQWIVLTYQAIAVVLFFAWAVSGKSLASTTLHRGIL